MAGITYDRASDGDIIMNATFGATNPTPGTGIAQAVSASFVDTAALAILRNTSQKTVAQGGKLILPRYLKLLCTVAPASGTDAHLVVAADPIDRFSSAQGGSQITVAGSRTDLYPTTGVGRFDFGAIVATAKSAKAIYVTRKVLKKAAVVVGDEFDIIFNDPDDGVNPALTGGSAQVLCTQTDGLALGPADGINTSLLFHLWYSSNATTPPQFEFEIGWVEKTP